MTFRRRLLMTVLAAALLLLNLQAARAVTPEDYDPDQPAVLEADHLYAESAFLVDMDTMEILLSKNSRVRMYPASTTKIMTALLALESSIGLDDTVTIPKEAGSVPEGSSVIGIKPGDTMTWRDLLYGLMLRSGNDGSNAIAVLAAGSIDAFVQRMNDKAAELNCQGTHFTNAHGYHDQNHYTTAQDLARMALYAMQNETFREIAATAHWQITVTRGGKTASTDVENRNSLVVPESNYYYPDATGIKTGHHNKAGRCVVASAEREGIRLMAVVMNCATEERQFNDARKLFEYGFAQYSPITMADLLDRIAPEVCTAQVDNAAEDDPQSGLLSLVVGDVSNGEVTRMLQRDSEKAMNLALDDIRGSLAIDWNRELKAPVTVGETLGTLRFDTPDGIRVSAQLTASRDVAAKPEPTPTVTAAPAVSADREVHPRGGAPIGLLLFVVFLLALAAALLMVLKLRADRRRRARRRAHRRRIAVQPGISRETSPRRKAAGAKQGARRHTTAGESAAGIRGVVKRSEKRK